MGRLAKALLVVVDATNISVDARADLFKNSRDRLSGGELRRDIEEELESQIASHHGLRELRERRRREEVTEKLSEAKPLEDVLRAIIKSSPSLSKLFLLGQRLSTPFRSGRIAPQGEGSAGGSAGTSNGKGDFRGKKHPTYFRFEKLKDGDPLERTCEHGRRCRLRFATDVENEYFVRDLDRGRYRVDVISGALEGRQLTTSINLYNGIANWSVAIPEEDVEPGEALTLQLAVEDDLLPHPIINTARISITDKTLRDGSGGRRRERSSGDSPGCDGNASAKGNNPEEGPPAGIQLPKIHKVRRIGWPQHNFDEHAACTVLDEGTGETDDEQSVYEFYINVDNLYLQTDITQRNGDPAILEAKFIYGNVLIGLALIHEQRRLEASRRNDVDGEEDEPITRRVEEITRALSPFLLPMVEYLGGLQEEEVSQLAQAGDEE